MTARDRKGPVVEVVYDDGAGYQVFRVVGDYRVPGPCLTSIVRHPVRSFRRRFDPGWRLRQWRRHRQARMRNHPPKPAPILAGPEVFFLVAFVALIAGFVYVGIEDARLDYEENRSTSTTEVLP